MARGKKSEKGQIIEKRLEKALVPAEKQPYSVPENWCWVYLTSGFAECLDSYRKPINATERANRSGKVPYYGATGQVGWIDDYLTNEQLVLVGEDGAPFLDLFKDKAYIIEGEAWVNNHAHILRSFYGEFGNHYLKNYLNIFNFTGYVNGTTRLKLTQGSLDTIPVPLPPLAEQQRIVDRIERLFFQLDEAKEKAQAVVDGFETRRAAILHKAFTGELTAQWRKEHNIEATCNIECCIGDIFDLQAGRNISAKEISKVKTEHFPYACYGGNGIRGYVNKFNCNGEHPIIGRQGALCGNVNLATGCFYATEHAVVVSYKKEIATLWACYYLSYLNLNQYATATAQPGLAVSNLVKVPIRYVPYREQIEISRILDNLLSKEQQTKETAEAVLDQIETMKKSILARAFRGELGTNDPAEGSGVELLKQIL